MYVQLPLLFVAELRTKTTIWTVVSTFRKFLDPLAIQLKRAQGKVIYFIGR